VNWSGLAPGVRTASVVQLVRSLLICRVRVRHGVLVMRRVTKPAGVREMGPKLGGASGPVGIVNRLATLNHQTYWTDCAGLACRPLQSATSGPAFLPFRTFEFLDRTTNAKARLSLPNP
jgi:hypothetical protein